MKDESKKHKKIKVLNQKFFKPFVRTLQTAANRDYCLPYGALSIVFGLVDDSITKIRES
jgi:hypothetical protein